MSSLDVFSSIHSQHVLALIKHSKGTHTNDKTIINNFNAIKRPAIFYHMVLQLILVEIIVKR